ncbi:hypothetical protein NBRC10513v2_007848 [Rhodotorula toruloides]|uniref:BY PROTMAP: gi/472583735/gb/EMS21359.1/ ARID/BRIGHT DNA-binding domain containing protein [Rhodosporidium toruloides NP11] gi/647403768/emb/CDR49834.1/ RHTO0S39e00232g1_1 [Rhodosporidium toruloides] n=1 Tax=Rhodotorula toruloides TaxID=5286 RepID=A0A0K3CC71_RHOTO|nr:hypothetical protein AAT19DRAFT_13658 [Rhodotorula toruloides]
MHSGWEQAQQPGFGPQYNGQLQAGQSQQHAFAQGQQHASSHQGGGVHASAVGGFAGDQGAWQGYQQPLQQQNGGYYQPPNQQVQQGGYQPVASTSAPVGGRQEQGGYTAGQQYGGVAQGMQYGVQSTHLRAMPQYPPQQPDSSGYAHFAQPPPAPLAQHPGPAPSPAPIQPQQHPTHHPPPPASAAYGTNFLQHSMQSFVPSSATMLSPTAQRFQSNPSPEHTQPHPPNPFPQQQQQQRPPPPPSSSHPPQQPPTPAQHLSPSAPTAAGLQNHLARFESITQHRQRLQQLDAQRNAVIGAGGGAEQVAQVERQMREVKTRELTLLSECETFVRQHGGAGAIQRYLEQMRANQQRFQQQQQQQFSQQTMPAQPAYSAQGYPQVLPNGGVQQGYSNAPQQPFDAQQQYPAAAPPPPRPAPSPRPQPPHQLHPQQQLGAVPSSSFNLQQPQQYPPAVADQQNASVDRSQLHPIPFPPPSSQDPTFQPPMRVLSVTMHPPSSSQPFQPGLPPQSQPPNPVNPSFPSLPHAPLPPRQAPMTASSAFPSDPRAQSAAQRVLPVSRAQVGQEPLPAPDGPMSNLVTREEWERMEKEREEREKKEGNPFGFPQGAGVAEKARRGKVRHPTQVLAEEVEGQPTLAELLAKVTPQKFYDVLKPLLAKHGQTLTPESHTLEGRPIDLFQLSQVVIGQGGGYVKVDADNAWPRVASLLRSPPSPAGSFATPPAPPPTHLPTHLRDLYMRLLARYEDGWSGTMLKQREKEIGLKGARELLLAKGKDAQAAQNGQAEGAHVGPTVQMGEPYKTPTMQIQHLQIVPSSPVSVNGTFGVSSAPLAPLSAAPSALVSSPRATLPASSMSSMFANSFSAFSLAPTDIDISPSVTSIPTGTITSTDPSTLAPSSPGKSNLLRPTTPHNGQQRVTSPGTPRSSAAAAGQVAPFSTAAAAASPAQPRTSTPRPVLLAREASGGSSSLIGSPNAGEGEKGRSRAASVASSSRKRDRTREIGDEIEVVGDEGRRKREGTGAVLTPEAGSSGPTRQNSTSTDGGSSGISGKLGMTPSRPAGGFVSSPAAMALSDGTPDLVANKALRPDTATTVSSTSASPHSVGGGEIPLPTAPLAMPTSMQTVTPSTPVNSGLALSAAGLSLSTPAQPSSSAPVKSPPDFDFLSLTSPALGGLEASPMLFNTASWSTTPSAFDSFTSSTETDSFGLSNTGDIFVGLGGDDAATNGAKSKQQLHPGADDDPWATSSLLDFEFVADSFTSS